MAGDEDAIKGLTDDLHRTNERMQMQENRLKAIEDGQATANANIAAILARLDNLAGSSIPAPRLPANNGVPRAQRVPSSATNNASVLRPAASVGSGANAQHGPADENDYSADSEDEDDVNHNNDRDHRRQRYNRYGMRRAPRRDRERDDAFSKVKFTIPPYDSKYDPDAYLTWELLVDQKFACHEFPEDTRVRAATSEFSDFASVWWKEHCRIHPHNIPTTWEALKQLMRHRFVPSYYARDLLNKLQRLNQGNRSVEDYYQELQMGMLRCGLIENEEASMARFTGGLNREIVDILAYKDYNSMTRLFHLALHAEHEVQGRSRPCTNFSVGRGSTWAPRTPAGPPLRTATVRRPKIGRAHV